MWGALSLSHHKDLGGAVVVGLDSGLNAWIGGLECHALDYREGDESGHAKVGLGRLRLVKAEYVVAKVLSRLDF